MKTTNWTFRKGSEPHHQASVYNEDTGEDVSVTYNDEDGKHARLIAAAPDLLDALIEAKKLLNSIRYRLPKSIKNSERFTFENTIANTIEIAINKATNP